MGKDSTSDKMNDYYRFAADNSMIGMALEEIESTYGDRVSVFDKRKTLIKFGRNENAGTSTSVLMQFQGSETEIALPTTNSIDYAVTTDANFTGTVAIEGHTIDGNNNLTFVVQTVTLTGRTKVPLTTPLARCSRIYIASADALASTTDKIFVFEDGNVTNGIPDTTSDIHILMDGKWGQSQKCQTSISSTDYWIITMSYGGVLRKTTANADIALQIRKVGHGQWRTVFDIPVNSTGSSWYRISAPPCFIVPKNTDVRLVSSANTSGVEVTGGIAGYLAKIIE